ncbi:hypothetical protein BDF20DRAFT_835107 [Mycotypha africana]|uniref:uncharacterized protein n=1 Tax=Mycotypha africana TaxID=64632 RepID=UPI0022FFD101|nr:uncharacterized protein BDF20DRAFT_835107 [Mycotypha africana]KAI8979042.1 hypothetical protein BDF20DRAFT_835107 [Mycotypha africana]
MATPSSPRIAGIEGTFTPATAQAFIEYVQSRLGQFETRMSEHDTLFQQLTQLKTENAELKKQNDDLRREMSELRSQLTHQGGHLQTSVDPTAPTVSSDEFVRPLVVGPLAKFFVEQGWFSQEDVQQALRVARRRLKEINAVQAAFAFRGIDTASESDSSVDADKRTGNFCMFLSGL